MMLVWHVGKIVMVKMKFSKHSDQRMVLQATLAKQVHTAEQKMKKKTRKEKEDARLVWNMGAKEEGKEESTYEMQSTSVLSSVPSGDPTKQVTYRRPPH